MIQRWLDNIVLRRSVSDIDARRNFRMGGGGGQAQKLIWTKKEEKDSHVDIKTHGGKAPPPPHKKNKVAKGPSSRLWPCSQIFSTTKDFNSCLYTFKYDASNAIIEPV